MHQLGSWKSSSCWVKFKWHWNGGPTFCQLKHFEGQMKDTDRWRRRKRKRGPESVRQRGRQTHTLAHFNHFNWNTKSTHLSTSAANITFLPQSPAFLIADNDEEYPLPPSLFSHFSAQLSNFVRVCGLREKTSIRRIVSSGWAEHFPKYVYLPDRKLTQFFLSPKKEEKVDESGMQIQQVLVAADENIDCLNES